MAFLAIVIFYFVLKYVANVTWRNFGLKKFRPPADDRESVAFRFGFYRLLIGVVFGFAVGLSVFAVAPGLTNGADGGIFLYLCTYIPVRWVEWTIMSFLIIRGSNPPGQWLFGLSEADRLCRLGGIGVSFLADIPIFIAAAGFPVGRILC